MQVLFFTLEHQKTSLSVVVRVCVCQDRVVFFFSWVLVSELGIKEEGDQTRRERASQPSKSLPPPPLSRCRRRYCRLWNAEWNVYHLQQGGSGRRRRQSGKRWSGLPPSPPPPLVCVELDLQSKTSRVRRRRKREEGLMPEKWP